MVSVLDCLWKFVLFSVVLFDLLRGSKMFSFLWFCNDCVCLLLICFVVCLVILIYLLWCIVMSLVMFVYCWWLFMIVPLGLHDVVVVVVVDFQCFVLFLWCFPCLCFKHIVDVLHVCSCDLVFCFVVFDYLPWLFRLWFSWVFNMCDCCRFVLDLLLGFPHDLCMTVDGWLQLWLVVGVSLFVSWGGSSS